MQKAIIFFFSGTGNTRIIAEKIMNELNILEIETALYDIRLPLQKIPNPNYYDYIGFGYPIHAFNAPEFFLDFIKKLPDVSLKPTFIFKTSGEPFKLNNASSWTLINKLKKKGYQPLIDEHFLMPYNIMFRYSKPIAKYMYEHNLKLAKVVAMKVQSNKSYLHRYNVIIILLMYISRVQWIGAKINGPLIHVKKNKCIKCQLCINECPSKNIEMINGYPKFDHTCTMCMNCASVCPVDAVRPGILNLWRINGNYDFKGYSIDETISDDYFNGNAKGYFRLFNSYYKKSKKQIDEWMN